MSSEVLGAPGKTIVLQCSVCHVQLTVQVQPVLQVCLHKAHGGQPVPCESHVEISTLFTLRTTLQCIVHTSLHTVYSTLHTPHATLQASLQLIVHTLM